MTLLGTEQGGTWQEWVGAQAEPWGSGPEGASLGLSWEWMSKYSERDPRKLPW